ncbi:uncharacterized protein TRIVIDRAFT_198948 [Trichoderma virens Gv29-8]|uniref:Uncharacterized protein n=1 Tax=Hypocrea virens (strain Gv29-8 / FGSC 10586) TaxID=413071 RepID=G9MLV9_HYPVG|nr:uncharacterized protein TRIVIDRAFT_198948 [Trichoderma virens Gv29-8]EHK24332.1 hypothetical protein TRIVIDRAFT_198948 [Trichoderma virens Gv29-8]UKZ54599.1 hypothetical protein TrVGV298_008409 [Trichoderma virens]
MDARETSYKLASADGNRGFMETYNDTTATGLSPLRQRDTSGFSGSSYESRPGHFHDSTSLLCARRSPLIKECYEDQFPFELAGDVHYNPWSPNSTSAPAWCPSEPSPSLLLNSEYGGAPAFLMGYGADNISSEYEAQLPWPESEPFPPRADMANFDDDVDPFGVTYYTPRGVDGAPDSICDPNLTAAGRSTSNRSAQQSVSEASPNVIPFRSFNRLGFPGQTAPVMVTMREAEASMPTSMMLQPLDQSLNPPSPLSVISPPVSLTSSTRKRNISVAGLEKSPVAPKKRVIKPQLTAKVNNSEDFEIQKDSELPPTGTYKAYFHTVDVARKKLQRLLELYRKPRESCSFPSTDDTFPTSGEDKMTYIRNLFDAINDWSNFREWPQALKTEERNRIMDNIRRKQAGNGDAGADVSLDDMRPSQEELESILPPLQDQQKRILGRLLSDQTIEWLCWELIRVEAMCYALRKSKQLVKSLLSAGDGWKLRIANNPQGELGHKGNNMKVNMNKNRKLRQITQGTRTAPRQKSAPKQSQK